MTFRGALPWVLLGVLGWGYVAFLGTSMLAVDPPTAGFDLALLLEAGRRVAEGASPYDPALVGGASVAATSLFYSYPPPVAQVMQLTRGLPDAAVLVMWDIGAAIAAVTVGVAVARAAGSRRPTVQLALPIAATLPFVLPFAVAMLFGNLNVWFPALYGLMLIAAIAPAAAPGAGRAVGGGIALAVVSIAKLHPASLGLWFLVRGWVERDTDRRPWQVVVVAILTGIAILGVSLLVGGLAPWQDYVAVVRAGAGADLVDSRNGAPAVIVGSLAGIDPTGVRYVQVGVTALALAATAVAAWRVRDPLVSFAVAAIASLVLLPVTWYHYPVALIPVAIAAVARADAVGGPLRRQVVGLVIAAMAVTTLAIVWVPAIWIGIGLLFAAVSVSGRRPADHP